jgi:CheY-like chemotaxis protein
MSRSPKWNSVIVMISAALSRHVPTILVVDDNDSVRAVTRRFLEIAGYQIYEAADGLKAWHVLADSALLDAVVTDLEMPGMNGWQLAACLTMVSPDLPVLFISGSDWYTASSELPGPLIAKPFSLEQLTSAVHRLLERDKRCA